MTDQLLVRRDTCTALMITCSDFRFKSAVRSFAARELPDDYDLIARPGSIRSLVAPRFPGARETIEAEIELLWSVHHFTRILMVNHISCRAYDDLATEQNEVEVHTAHLLKAKTIIESSVRGVVAEPYLVRLVDGALRVVPIPTPTGA